MRPRPNSASAVPKEQVFSSILNAAWVRRDNYKVADSVGDPKEKLVALNEDLFI